MTHLPPLPAIRAFEAAARHLSFTKAAEELGMTQAAVSYQMKVLEERIGVPLFIRKPRQVELSEPGRRLAAAASDAFDILKEAYESVREDVAGTLVITTVAPFAIWLAKYLGPFQIAHPSLAVRIAVSPEMLDLTRSEADVGVRSGNGKWRDLTAHRLLDAEFTPLLSPRLAETIGGVKKPAHLLKLPILSPDDPWWEDWFKLAGMKADLSNRPVIQFDGQALEGTAAIAGRGVGVLTPAFFQDELRSGALVRPFDITGHEDRAYWLVYATARRNLPKIRAFRECMLAEAARTLGSETQTD